MLPLLEPAVLVSENCSECRGTGRRREEPCGDCGGSGRMVREVPMSEAHAMMVGAHERLVAPPPSMVREHAIADAAEAPEGEPG